MTLWGGTTGFARDAENGHVRGRSRRRMMILLAAVLCLAIAGPLGAVTGQAAPAAAQPAVAAQLPADSATVKCSPSDLYFISVYSAATGAPVLRKYSGGALTTVKALSPVGQGAYPDALGVTSSGFGYYIQSAPKVGTAPTIYRVDLTSGVQTSYTGTAPQSASASETYPAGAVDTRTGIYYYAEAANVSGYPWDVYAFDTFTNTPIGYVGRIQVTPSGGLTGDLAFDADGNLYLSTNATSTSIMKVAAANVPTTAQAAGTQLKATAVGPQNETSYATGLAYMGAESSRPLWSASYNQTALHKITPGLSDSTTGPDLGDNYIYDLASCPTGGTPKLALSKNVVSRVADSDQFALTIERPAGTVLATATTSGTSLGVQSQVAGAIDAVAGATYTLREVGSGTTSLGTYGSSLTCVDVATNATISTSGSGGVASLVYPSSGVTNVSCTFTNVPPPTITVTKTLPGGRYAASDQFTVELRKGTSSAAVLSTPGNETTTGQGTTVDAGTGTTGRVQVTAGSAYTITESADAGVDMTHYTATITCTDAAGQQSGLPNGASFDPATGYQVTPQAGAQIACTIANRASSGAGVGVGQGLTCQTGSIYAIAGTNPDTDGQLRVRSYSYVYRIDTATGAATPVLSELPTSWSGVTYEGRTNALAVSQGGLYSYYSTQRLEATDPAVLPVFRQDNTTGTTVLLATMKIPVGVTFYGVSGAAATVRGGIDPTTGIYWISASTDDTTHHFWAYNTLTGQNYGYVGYITGTSGGPAGTNGDLVFDQDGNMLFVTSTTTTGQLFRIRNLSAALTGAPRATVTSVDSLVTKEKLTNLTTSGQFNGVSFDNDGYIYVSYMSSSGANMLQKLDPDTGLAAGAPVTISGLSAPGNWIRGVTDLADCNDPGGLRLQKNYPGGRVNTADNVKLEVSKVGVSTSLVGGVATTSGPATGLQSAYAGVIIGVPGGTYVLTETATSGQLTDYSTSLSCVDKTHGNAPMTVTKVSQGQYTLAFPGVSSDDGQLLANVVCTYVNTPNGTLQLQKNLGGARTLDTDQFMVRILASPAGSVAATATTTGSGTTVQNGVTPAVRAQTTASGTQAYSVGELGWTNGASAPSVLNFYPNATVTCVDPAGVQPSSDLPIDLALSAFAPITPKPGAQILCTITNTPLTAKIAVVKSGSTQCLTSSTTPTTVTYTYTVTNPGLDPLKGITLSDAAGTPVYQSGDTGGDKILTPGETWIYTLTTQVSTTTTTIVTATGTGTVSGRAASATSTFTVSAPALAVTKSSSANGSPVNAGDTVTYTVKVTNSTAVDATNVTVDDPLPTGVTYVSGSAQKSYPSGGATAAHAPSGLVTASDAVTLKSGESLTVTYKVKVNNPLDPAVTSLTNTATTNSAGSCPAIATVTDPVAPPTKAITVQKRALNCDVGTASCALPGSMFALYSTDPSTAGAQPIASGLTVSPSDGSVFTSTALKLGTYWLVETRAPSGFTLLATPIKFSLSASGITLASPSAGVVVTSGSAFTIQVSDAAASPLPAAGGPGPWAALAGGLLLFGLAAFAFFMTSGSRRPRGETP